MIKTQLCPAGELENKTWWYFDVGFLLIVLALSYYGVTGYLDARKNEVTRLIEKKAHWDNEFQSKAPHVEKFKTLNMEIATLNQKIGALSRITTSKVDKVKPLVALDQLQTLRMDGVWYEQLEYKEDGSISILGAGYDSMIIGEFMLGVRETMNVDTQNDDIRTQLGFDQLAIKSATYKEGADDIFSDVTSKMQFEMNGKHTEKKAAAAPSVSLGPRPRASGRVGF